MWFMQDGDLPHFSQAVRVYFYSFSKSMVGRGGVIAWSPRSPDINPLDFSI